MDEAWKQIVAEALAVGLKTSNGPVPGAKLRQLILKVAKQRDLAFPPNGHGQESFGDFLKHFESIALVRRREGRDLLVAPADMPQLLADAPESGVARLREDIFEAFTRIPRGLPPSEPWYVVSNDTVVWLLPTELSGSRGARENPGRDSGAGTWRAKVFHPIRRFGGRRQESNRWEP